MSLFPSNKIKEPQKDRGILAFIEQDLDKADSPTSSDDILDEDYDDAPIKKLKTEKHTSKTPIILIDDSGDSSSSSLTQNKNNYNFNKNSCHQKAPPPPSLPSPNSQSLPYFPQYTSSEYPKINLLNQLPYQQHPPPLFHPSSFPQWNKPPIPSSKSPSQENSSYKPFKPSPPNSFNPQSRPQEPQIPLSNQKSSPVNYSREESKGIAMETEQSNKMPKDQQSSSGSMENVQKMPVSELAKRTAIAKKSSKGRPKEVEGTSGNGASYIQPVQAAQINKLPEKTNSDGPNFQKSQKEAIKTVDKSSKLDFVGKPQDQKEIPQTSKISDARAQNLPYSPIMKSTKKPGSGASVPVFTRQRIEEVKTEEKKRSPEKGPKKQRHIKNISLFQPSSNQELHELIAKELNEDDEIEVDTELTLNELIVNYSNRHQNKKCPSLRLHEYFELIEAPRHKPEEYPVNYKLFL